MYSEWERYVIDIFMCSYVCIVFSMVRSCTHLQITLTPQQTQLSTWARVAQTNVEEKVREKAGTEERKQTE